MHSEDAAKLYTLRCHFCTKTAKEVAKLIQADYAVICADCVLVCVEILKEDGHITSSADEWKSYAFVLEQEIDRVKSAVTRT